MNRPGILAIVYVALGPPCFGATIHVGSFNASFSQSSNWSLRSVTYSGAPIVSLKGSANGTVIRMGDSWLGSTHGNETLEQAALYLDGIPSALDDSSDYDATTQATLEKTTVLGVGANGLYRLQSHTQIEADRMTETTQFQGLAPSSTVTIFYGWLGSRHTRLTHWAAFDGDGNFLGNGVTAAGDDAEHAMPVGTRAVAQYDPIAGNGIVSKWTLSQPLSTSSMIWDRSTDRKLYFRLLGAENAADKNFTLIHSMRTFDANETNWISAASHLVPEPSSEVLVMSLLFVAGYFRRRFV
jgi:hypothetical protein